MAEVKKMLLHNCIDYRCYRYTLNIAAIRGVDVVLNYYYRRQYVLNRAFYPLNVCITYYIYHRKRPGSSRGMVFVLYFRIIPVTTTPVFADKIVVAGALLRAVGPRYARRYQPSAAQVYLPYTRLIRPYLRVPLRPDRGEGDIIKGFRGA